LVQISMVQDSEILNPNHFKFNAKKKKPIKLSIGNVAHYDYKQNNQKYDYAAYENKIRKHFYLGLDETEYHKYYDDLYS
jgi:hypothetical protein